jgi:hypothetical protein
MNWSAEQQREYRRRLQAVTGRQAARVAEPWTVHDDLVLYLGTAPLAALAARLQRTYYATCARRALLLDPSTDAALRLERYLADDERPEAARGRLTA